MYDSVSIKMLNFKRIPHDKKHVTGCRGQAASLKLRIPVRRSSSEESFGADGNVLS